MIGVSMKFWKSTRKDPLDSDFQQLVKELRAWVIPSDAVEEVYETSRVSLNEVKALTEYEDGKATRLLTVAAFMSAAVGAIYARFGAVYPWPQLGDFSWSLMWVLPTITYGAFIIYVLTVIWSSFLVFNAIKPTFKIPKTWIKGSKGADRPTSMIFYKGILDTTGVNWGNQFKELARDSLALKSEYAKCNIAEAYLVAGKVADKYKKLVTGLIWLRVSMLLILLFVILLAATFFFVKTPLESGRPEQPLQLSCPAPQISVLGPQVTCPTPQVTCPVSQATHSPIRRKCPR